MMQWLTVETRQRVLALLMLACWTVGAFGQAEEPADNFNLDLLIVSIAIVGIIGVFVLLYLGRNNISEERLASNIGIQQNARLGLVLRSGNLRLWLYDVVTRHYILLAENGEPEGEYNPVEFQQFYEAGGFEQLRSLMFDICEGKKLNGSLSLHSALAADGTQRHYRLNVSIVSSSDKGRPTRLLGIQRDVTGDVLKQQEINQLLIRYHTVFTSAFTDMLYYDADGRLREANERARNTFCLTGDQEDLVNHYSLQENPFFGAATDFQQLENQRSTSVLNFTDSRYAHYKDDWHRTGDTMYYESTINPLRGADGQLEGVYMVGRDVTEMVQSFRHQQESTIQLREAMQKVETYVKNINYALSVSNVRLVAYDPYSYTLELSDSISGGHIRLSQLRCIRLATPRFRRAVSSLLNRMDHLTRHTLTQNIETELRDKQGRPMWLMFSMVPLFDKDNRLVRYFGMCRDMTELVETEQRLVQETRKAQEAESLKQTFLTNMSYEIRTPLNTVVGFAELFESDHDPADEPVFVEEIKKNSNTLLQLVNDILFISRLDANMIEYTKADVDFALIFESHCQMGWSRVKPAVKTVVDNPFEKLVVDIDQTHLGMVIEKLCALAADFTDEGVVRARYEYRRGELLVIIEDTGQGIDKDTLPHVFDRFVRNNDQLLCGTGLNLPIVQLMVHQMGGTIEMDSELGKGSSVWFTIPCEAKTVLRRHDMMLNSSDSAAV